MSQQDDVRSQMFKQEILDGILTYARAEGVELSRKQADTAYNGLIHTVAEALAQGRRVNFIKFGSLEVRHRPERPSWDMHRKKMVTRPPHNYVYFGVGTSLNKMIQNVRFKPQEQNGKVRYLVEGTESDSN